MNEKRRSTQTPIYVCHTTDCTKDIYEESPGPWYRWIFDVMCGSARKKWYARQYGMNVHEIISTLVSPTQVRSICFLQLTVFYVLNKRSTRLPRYRECKVSLFAITCDCCPFDLEEIFSFFFRCFDRNERCECKIKNHFYSNYANTRRINVCTVSTFTVYAKGRRNSERNSIFHHCAGILRVRGTFVNGPDNDTRSLQRDTTRSYLQLETFSCAQNKIRYRGINDSLSSV